MVVEMLLSSAFVWPDFLAKQVEFGQAYVIVSIQEAVLLVDA